MKYISFRFLSPYITWVGEKFGIDAHYFAKSSFLVMIGHTVSIVRGLITGYLVARLFQKEVYGAYQFILSVMGIISLFGLPGLAHSVTRAWARGDAFSLKQVLKKQFVVCLMGSLILLGCIPFLAYYNRQELWPLFVVGAILFPLSPMAMVIFGGYTVGKARFDTSLRANIQWSIISILVTLVIIFFHQSAMLLLIAGMSIPSLVYLYNSKNIKPPKEDGEENTKAIIRYGWQLTFSTLPVNIVWYIDKLMISQLFGLNQLALFSVALLIPEQVKILAKQLFPVTFSRQAQGEDSKERRRKLMKAVLLGTAVFAVGITLYIAVCPWLMPLLFPTYAANELVLLTSVASLSLIVIPGTLFSQYLEARGMIKEIQYASWGAAAVFGVMLFLLIPMYGLLGAIIARAVFRFVYMGVTWWMMMRSPIIP